eukprot:XP_017453654.1 PREDICTED: probable G-protein coupled receptor 156 [Rattus norvegicus]
MEPEINCSEFCDSFPGQELDRRPLHDLCKTTITDSQHGSADISPLSPALLGVIWTFLSCGLLLVLFFLAFTIRCRKNRIVKMSSPNLNIVTLLGSCLTYSSAYLFGIQDALVGSSVEALIQTRLSLLCIGTTLVFGPILGKSWRLYKVFTQRVPDKRVGHSFVKPQTYWAENECCCDLSLSTRTAFGYSNPQAPWEPVSWPIPDTVGGKTRRPERLTLDTDWELP